MLLEFKTENFKSFYEELDFKMTPAPKQKGLDYSILKTTIGKKTYKGLCTAVIYGPNAAGKTNIIGAMDVCRRIMLRGHIRNVEEQNMNVAATRLELIPNRTDDKQKATKFYIKFIVENLLIEYELMIHLGRFLKEDDPREILQERLAVNEQTVFIRTAQQEQKQLNAQLAFFDMGVIQDFLISEYHENEKSAKILAESSLVADELFLTNGFKMMFSPKLTHLILQWIEHNFLVMYRADTIEINKRVSESKEGTLYFEKTVNEAAKLFGINSNALGYVVPQDGNEAQLYSLFKEQNAAIPAKLFESYGTVRFIHMFPLIIRALMNGAVLVLDEFDANIHPMALMNIINLFHNDDINKKKAQLIFNTHNPIFLNPNVLRRDEIKFVERDDDTHYSTQYALSDFKTAGPNGVRNTSDYMERYFLGRYGAIKDIDFYDVFESMMKEM